MPETHITRLPDFDADHRISPTPASAGTVETFGIPGTAGFARNGNRPLREHLYPLQQPGERCVGVSAEAPSC